MADVFVSYKRDDRAKVQQLLNGLRSAGVSVWNDEYLEPGERWAERIESEVSSARVVIVAWSRASVESEWVKAEARAARNQGKLIQVFCGALSAAAIFW